MLLPPLYVPANHAPQPPASVVIRQGDTLSKTAQEFHDTLAQLLGWNPEVTDENLVFPGERIAVAVHGPHSPVDAYVGRHRVQDATRTVAALSGPGTAPSAPASSGSGGQSSADLAYQACVISRESGGSAQVMNSSGHWGLYQFSYDTWIAFGGAPSAFGNASAAEQDRVFWSVMAAGDEYGTWSEWDGCPLP